MAGTVSAWSKPGAWALDSEENEEELQRSRAPDPPAALQADFPSLSIAATTKTKKKKPQSVSLAEFTYSKPAEQQRAAEIDLLSLPTGPRQRTAEELDRTRLGGGFRSYGMGNHRDEEGGGRRERGAGGFGRDPNRDSAPSRADEIDNWASGKKAPLSRERGDRGGFFDNHSRADESDSWVSMKKSFPTPTEGGRRFGGGGFGSGGGADSENWGRKKEDSQTEGRRFSGGGFDRDRFGSGGADSEKWGRNKEARTGETVETENAGGRPKLNLKPRTLPVVSKAQVEKAGKASNPFGEARPREEVLAEKGQDWKKIDEQLESNKIKEIDGGLGRKKAFGHGNGEVEDKSERSWRKHVAFSDNNEYIDDERPASAEKAESEPATEEN